MGITFGLCKKLSYTGARVRRGTSIWTSIWVFVSRFTINSPYSYRGILVLYKNYSTAKIFEKVGFGKVGFGGGHTAAGAREVGFADARSAESAAASLPSAQP